MSQIRDSTPPRDLELDAHPAAHRIAAQALRYCFADFLRATITMTMMIIAITLNHSSGLVPVPPVSGAVG